jgi:hypothetical protein
MWAVCSAAIQVVTHVRIGYKTAMTLQESAFWAIVHHNAHEMDHCIVASIMFPFAHHPFLGYKSGTGRVQ